MSAFCLKYAKYVLNWNITAPKATASLELKLRQILGQTLTYEYRLNNPREHNYIKQTHTFTSFPLSKEM